MRTVSPPEAGLHIMKTKIVRIRVAKTKTTIAMLMVIYTVVLLFIP